MLTVHYLHQGLVDQLNAKEIDVNSQHAHQTGDQAENSGSCCSGTSATPKRGSGHTVTHDKHPAEKTAETNAKLEKPSHGGCCGGH